MTKEQAYCCLNCANSPSCCEPCGECESCCEDCGDTSMCQGSAYFKDGSFYKNYVNTTSSSSSYEYVKNNGGHKRDTSYTSTYTSADNICLTYGSSLTTYCFDDGDEGASQWFCNGAECQGNSCSDNDECFTKPSGPQPCHVGRCDGSGDCIGTYSPTCGCADDTCPGFDSGCSGLECICDDPEDECEGDFVSKYTAKITFTDPVKLYNKEGQDVGNIIGATYDPCGPCATWGAPACHFFAP